MLILDYAAASDRGLVRGNNEDSAYAGPNILVLADGMGGHAAGEVASQLMVRKLSALDTPPGDNDMLALMGMVADEANADIAQGIIDDPATDGMGTTLTALMFNGREFGLCHVGDSRGYRMRDGELSQITMDDTFVQSLVNEGKLDPEDVSTHPQRSLILKAYTGHPVEPTLELLDARVGDRLLLCSDGLSDPVTHTTIEQALGVGDPTEAASRLVELALRSGGPDNVTVIVADVVEVDDATAARAGAAAPVTAGALNGEQPDDPRPDTAAGRAAILARRPQTITPDGEAHPQASLSSPPPLPEEPETGPKPRKLTALIVALIVLIGLVTAGWWGYSRVEATYFVSANDQEVLQIENGVDFTIFGRDLHSPHTTACLSASGDLSLTEDCGTTPEFTLTDLPASVRGSIDGLPSGDYNEVQQQMQRLAEQALPVCVTRESSEGNSEENGANSADEAAAAEAEPVIGGDRSEPGVNCREVT